MDKICKTSPCKDCPYRMDAPLRRWDISEFIKVLNSETDMLGSIFSCHKNDGTLCTGWLIDQDKRRLPSIMLRIKLSREQIDASFFDKLKSKAQLYESPQKMCFANYPELLEVNNEIYGK